MPRERKPSILVRFDDESQRQAVKVAAAAAGVSVQQFCYAAIAAAAKIETDPPKDAAE